MKFGYTIIYVASVADTLAFYQAAFGFEAGDYGELETGATTLAFASHALGEMNLAGRYQKVDRTADPFGVELAFVADDVPAAYAQAIAAGAISIQAPMEKPWGQVVGYVRSQEGSLIELCSPMGA
jgi:lactoylglutathione lyase